ncbi:disulfide bond formation protein B [Caulobacter sp. KR2-114]|uniref:disulfide bond formation protein B n=1 Tax=Caulobacter sp. KR2-114 TaxID=3400912 RepID=UPI003C0B49D1
MSVLSPILARWPWFAFIAAAAMLGAAHGFETFMGLKPCELCLKQREAYWIAGSVALAGIVLGFTPLKARATRLVNLVLVAAFLYSLGWAGYHAGVEWHFWPGPKACSGGTTVSAADIDAMLKGAKVKAVMCDQVVWSWLGLSMAGWNTLISLVLVALSAMAAARRSPA